MKILKVYQQALSRAGLEVRESTFTNGGHIKLSVAREGGSITASVFASKTPSDGRALANVVSTARNAVRQAEDRWNGGKRH